MRRYPIAPFMFWIARQTMLYPGWGRALWRVCVGAVLPIAALGWYNWSVTGTPWLPPAWVEISGSGAPDAAAVDVGTAFWNRFGAHLSYGVITLCVSFAGLIGLVLIALGVMANRFTQLLAIGVALGLATLLFEGEAGAKRFGTPLPEALAPLAILAAYGACRLSSHFGSAPVKSATVNGHLN